MTSPQDTNTYWNSTLQRNLIICPYCPEYGMSMGHTMNTDESELSQFLSCIVKEHHTQYVQDTGVCPEFDFVETNPVPVNTLIPCPFCPTETELCRTMELREKAEYALLDCSYWEHYHRYIASTGSQPQ
jgi:hypothetical protein